MQEKRPYPNMLFGRSYNWLHAEVANIQRALVHKGFGVGSAGIDGKFGKDTEYAAKRFQEAYKITGSIKKNGEGDGIVGRDTWNLLF